MLLQAGWGAVQADAAAHAVNVPAALRDLPNDPDQAFNVFATAYAAVRRGTIWSRPRQASLGSSRARMADSMHEQHTHYLPPALMQRFLSVVGGGQQAVGLGREARHRPARSDHRSGARRSRRARLGCRPATWCVAADGKDLSHADTPSLAAALTGPGGSSVTLTVDRGGDSPITVTATRGAYYFPPLESRMLDGGVGYLRLTDFVISGTNLPNGIELLADLDRRLDELDAQGAQGLILDLRNNGGGSVQTADELLGRFLPDTARSVRESDQRGHETFELAGGRMHGRQLPMAVMINGGSASASEIIAAALRDAPAGRAGRPAHGRRGRLV